MHTNSLYNLSDSVEAAAGRKLNDSQISQLKLN
jgi:hypothetical protein